MREAAMRGDTRISWAVVCVVLVTVLWVCSPGESQPQTRINLRYSENGRLLYEFPPPGRVPGPSDGYYGNSPLSSRPSSSGGTRSVASQSVPSSYQLHFSADIN